jgi:hypothetical protein
MADEDALRKLATPARNHYFYGKLLNVSDFELEQNYFNRKRWLLNRLSLGSGVVCGLAVAPTLDGKSLRLGPGLAIDQLGREIIVPGESPAVDPRQPNDIWGRPVGQRLDGVGTVLICLALHECETDAVPVLVGDCGTDPQCAPSVIRERYAIVVQQGTLSPVTPACGLADIFTPATGQEEAANPYPALAQRLSQACPEVVGDPYVVLAQVNLPAANEAITAAMIDQSVRPLVFNTPLLFELILCLAERVDSCCRVRVLQYVDGDAQQAAPKAALGKPLVVEVQNGEGQPVKGVPVTFRIQGGGGKVGGSGSSPNLAEISVNSGDDGKAAASWLLGPAAGLNTLTASLASGSRITFHAWAAAT